MNGKVSANGLLFRGPPGQAVSKVRRFDAGPPDPRAPIAPLDREEAGRYNPRLPPDPLELPP